MVNKIKKLYRSANDKFIGGVCGGVAEYLNLDSTLIRLLWLLLVFFAGSGVILYIIALIIVPLNPNIKTDENGNTIRYSKMSFGFIFGAFFIVLGFLMLLHNTGIIPHYFWHMKWDIIFACLLIVVGLLFLFRDPKRNTEYRSFSESSSDNEQETETGYTSRSTLFKSVNDRKIFGVCGGIAEYFNVDSSIVRIAMVFFTFVTGGLALVLYIACGLILPDKRLAKS